MPGRITVTRKIWAGLLLILLASIASVWFLSNYTAQPAESGFRIISLENNIPLVTDADVLSYNWTSQEITLTNEASQRLIQMGQNLYNYSSGFVIKINGEEVYRGVFRSPIMSAIPEPPKISIMFPSMLFPSENQNNQAIRMFYPGFQPPIDQPEKNLQLSQYFEEANKLTH